MVLAGQRLVEGDGGELAVRRRQAHARLALDELLVAPAVLDEVGDGDHLQPVARAVGNRSGDPRHRAVVVHDLADDAGRVEAGEAGQVDRGLGLARCAGGRRRARARSGKTWPGWTRSAGRRGRVDRDLDRVRAVVRGDAGRHALARLDGDGEGGAERRLVLLGHLAQAELVAALLGEAEADQPARVRDHEVDRLGRRELRGDRQVALVLAVLVVDDDDELALRGCPRSPPRSWRRALSVLRLGGSSSRAHRSPASSRSTYLAEDVGLEVHGVARREQRQRRQRERVRDQRDLEAVLA